MKPYHCVLILRCLGFIAPVQAEQSPGDPAPFEFLGYSDEGQFAAFTYAGSPAESGQYIAKSVFVDVAKNSLAAPTITKTQKTLQTARSSADKASRPVLKRLKIYGSILGEQLYIREMIFGHNTRAIEAALLNDPKTISVTEYEFAMDSLQGLPAPHCTDPDYKPLGLRIVLKNKKSGEEQILQSDSRVPKGRRCPILYGIKAIYKYRDFIAVILFVLSPGFEAFPEVDYMAVTGAL